MGVGVILAGRARMNVGGIVLCGGRSSRMGRPKAWLPFGDEVLLQRVVRILVEAVDPVVVVAAPGQDVPPLPPGVAVVRDAIEGKGPLGGLAAGLAALEGKVDAAYLSACDVPFLTPAFVRRVVAGLEEPNPPAPFPRREGGARGPLSSSDSPFPPREGGWGVRFFAAVPQLNDRLHPLAAAYRMAVLPEVRRRLAADRLRATALFDSIPTRNLDAHELPDADSLRNLNTPADYTNALRDLAAPRG